MHCNKAAIGSVYCLLICITSAVHCSAKRPAERHAWIVHEVVRVRCCVQKDEAVLASLSQRMKEMVVDAGHVKAKLRGQPTPQGVHTHFHDDGTVHEEPAAASLVELPPLADDENQ
jgi:hypothetical protein